MTNKEKEKLSLAGYRVAECDETGCFYEEGVYPKWELKV